MYGDSSFVYYKNCWIEKLISVDKFFCYVTCYETSTCYDEKGRCYFMEYIMLVFSAIGLIFTFFWIKKPDDDKDRFFAIFSLVGCIVMLTACLLLIFA